MKGRKYSTWGVHWNHINRNFSKHLHAASSLSTKQFPRSTPQSITYLNLNTKFLFIIPPLSSAVLCLCGLAVQGFSFALGAAGPKISKCTCYKRRAVFFIFYFYFCTSAGRPGITLGLSPSNGKVTLTRLRSGNLCLSRRTLPKLQWKTRLDVCRTCQLCITSSGIKSLFITFHLRKC